MNYPTAEKELQVIAKRITEQIKEAIQRSNKVNTGSLYNSVKYIMTKTGFRIVMKRYGKYVFKGRLAGKKQPPVKAIEAWINTPHGISFYNKFKATYKKATTKQAAFVVARSIKKRGIKEMKQKSMVDLAYSIRKTEGFKNLRKAYAADIAKQLKKELK